VTVFINCLKDTKIQSQSVSYEGGIFSKPMYYSRDMWMYAGHK